MGCTIIDINPGIGLWSSMLHDYLKPRNHILMEPKQKIYLPFLQPLLDTPGSSYQLKDWPESDLWHPRRYVEEGLLPDEEGHGGPPPTTENPNNSILIVANMVGQRAKIRREIGPVISAHRAAIHLSHAVKHQTGFQRHGPLRVLLWLSDEDTRGLLPRTVGYRAKTSVHMEANFDLEQIVSFPLASDSKIRREDGLDIESSKQVARRMQERDIKIPVHRQRRLESERSDLSEVTRPWHKELRQLEEDYQLRKFSKYVESSTGESSDQDESGARSGKGSKRKLGVCTPEYKKMMTLRSVANGQNVSMDRINKVLREQEKIDQMDLDLHRDNIDSSEQRRIIEALDSSIQDYKKAQETLTVKQLKTLFFLDDDRRAFAMDPPLLMWDRRKAEPLLAKEDDFYGSGKVALLDFQPKRRDEMPMTSEQSLYFDMISTCIFGPRGQTTLRHLKTIAPGAFEALVPQVPAIRDPRKGGRYDIDSVRARVLTLEMIHGLAVAWDNWAFKPPVESALTQFGISPEEIATRRKGAIATL